MPLGGLRLKPEVQRLVRDPSASELQYFGENPTVSGMAAEDGRVILNPNSGLSDDERSSVVMNEAARLHMRSGKLRPAFALTEQQKQQFSTYGTEQDQRETIAARILSGDPSAGDITPEQRQFAKALSKAMNGTE